MCKSRRSSHHSSPGNQRVRDRPPKSRSRRDSEPDRPHRPKRTEEKCGTDHLDDLDDSEKGGRDGAKPDGPPRSANPKASRIRMARRPSFTISSGNFGTDAPIPIGRDPVAQNSEQRRTDMNAVADSTADAMGKEEKAGQLSVRRMNIFTLVAPMIFSEYRIPPDAGLGGDQLVDALRRISISQRRDLYRFAPLFFLTENIRNDFSEATLDRISVLVKGRLYCARVFSR